MLLSIVIQLYFVTITYAGCGDQQGTFVNSYRGYQNRPIEWVISTANSGEPQAIKIIGGSQARSGQWPWQVLIEYVASSNELKLCGGTVISSRHVLTAAHCAISFGSRETVYVGTLDSTKKQGGFGVAISRTRIHSLYNQNSVNQEHDIAVLTLDQSISFGPTIQPICLPKAEEMIDSTARLWVTGWGLYNQGTSISTQQSEYLQYSALPNVPLDQCRRLWGDLPYEYSDGFQPLDTQICAGSKGHGTAQGDSGGPLVMQGDDGRWVQVGITSFGVNQGPLYFDQATAPGIYTRISAHCDFIESSTNNEAVCSSISIFSPKNLIIPLSFLLFYLISN